MAGRPKKYDYEPIFLREKIATIDGLSPDEKEFLLAVLAKRIKIAEFCPQGHRRTALNTSYREGYRRCRICDSVRRREKIRARRLGSRFSAGVINA